MSWSVKVMGATVLASLVIGGCGGGSSSSLPDPTVRFVNVSPDTTSLDFALNDNPTAAGVAYLGSSPDFSSVDFISPVDGGYDITITQAGGSLELDRVVVSPPFLNRDTDNLVFSIGLANPNGELLKRAQILIWQVNRTAPTGNKARLYPLNALQRPAGFENDVVTLQTIDPGNPASIDNPQFSRPDIPYGQGNTPAPLEIDSGVQTFIGRRGETGAALEIARTQFTFADGGIYLAIISGIEGSANSALQPKVTFIQLSAD